MWITTQKRPSDRDGAAGSAAMTRTETYCLATVRHVAAMLDRDPVGWKEGDVVPRGWQFPLLGADAQRSTLRQDGFPGLGVPLPDLGLPRLMILSRTVRFGGDIAVGASLRRTSRLQKLSRRTGPNGPFAIVTVEHEIAADETSRPLLTETQTYILLGPTWDRATAKVRPAAPPALTKRVVPDDTLLFQYSALGFNSHRIHIDRAYAQGTEGFPDLVVNGGLATLLLTEFFAEAVGHSLTSLEARYLVPLFSGRPIALGIKPRDGAWRLTAHDDTGRLAVDIAARAARPSASESLSRRTDRSSPPSSRLISQDQDRPEGFSCASR